MPDMGDERDWRGRELIDRDGVAVGPIRSVELDDAGEPAWARVATGGSDPATRLVPLVAATRHGSVVRVPYDRALILAAPTVQGPLSSDDEASLAEHYGLDLEGSMEPDESSGDDAPRWDANGDDGGDAPRWDAPPRREEATGDVGDIGDF